MLEALIWVELFVITIFLWEAWNDAVYSLIYLVHNARPVCPAPEWAGTGGTLSETPLSPWGIQRLRLTFPSENPLVRLDNFLPLGLGGAAFSDHHTHVVDGQCLVLRNDLSAYDFVNQLQITRYIPNFPSLVSLEKPAWAEEVAQFSQLTYFYMMLHKTSQNTDMHWRLLQQHLVFRVLSLKVFKRLYLILNLLKYCMNLTY